MYSVRLLPEFSRWLAAVKDHAVRMRLARRLEKAQAGNLGDVAPVGDGVMEMREHFGRGWRMYYVQRGPVVIVMLGGGDKASQRQDIETAKKRAGTLQGE